jgi:hypothetical protein
VTTRRTSIPSERTGRGDPQGGSIQHGAGCGATVLIAIAGVLAIPAAVWWWLV